MARRRAAAGSRGVRILVTLLIVLLVLGAIYGIYLWQQRQADTRISSSQPQDLVSDERMIFGGIPRAKKPSITFNVLKSHEYMVGYSESRKDPLWSAYRVRKEEPFKLPRPKGNFLTDFRTRAQVTHQDYVHAGYDRGHMTPNSAIARCYGAEAQHETFLLSNVCPQSKALNEKVWESLEEAELQYATDDGEVWVMDGPVFSDIDGEDKPVNTLAAGIAIPAFFYKILIEDSSGGRGQGVRAFAVIMPQDVKGTEHPAQFVRSIKEIEDETGLEFLWKLEPRQREKLESQVAPQWPVP